MAKDPFQQQKQIKTHPVTAQAPRTPYQHLYGLRENPFPANALFAAATDDPRRNGQIYDQEFRQDEERAFFEKFVQPPTGDRPLDLGFLLLDPQAGGRGNGKSTFLFRLMQRINDQNWSDWPRDPDDPGLLAVGVHVLPEPRRQKNFFELARLVFETMYLRGIFRRIDGHLRASALLELATPEQLQPLEAMSPEARTKVLTDGESFGELLAQLDISPDAFTGWVETTLREVRGQDVWGDFLGQYLAVGADLHAFWQLWEKEGVARSDYRWQRQGPRWLVNDLVAVLVAAGYRRFYLLLDEFEKIYQYQTSKKREEFLDLLRQHLLERDSVAVKRQYISALLTLHPSIVPYLRAEWARTGLEQFAPLAPGRTEFQSIKLGASTASKLNHLLITYLDYFRMDSQHRGEPHPFQAGALEPVFTAARFYPRDTLWYANNILARAAREGHPAPIPGSYVNQFLEEGSRPPPDEDELPESDTILRE